jgi:hypothetical protein
MFLKRHYINLDLISTTHDYGTLSTAPVTDFSNILEAHGLEYKPADLYYFQVGELYRVQGLDPSRVMYPIRCTATDLIDRA